MLSKHQIHLGEGGDLVTSVARWGTSQVSAGAREAVTNELVIANARARTIVLYVEKWATLPGNEDRLLPPSGKRGGAAPFLGPGTAPDHEALPINCIQPTAIFIKAQVGNAEPRCLVDTGASVSLISREFVVGPLRPCSLKARGISGEQLQVLGMKELSVNINNLQVNHPFVVIGMRNTCILGADFLKSGLIVVDVANAKLSWPTGQVGLTVEATAPTVNKLSVLLESYSDVFVTHPHDSLGRTTEAEHCIDTGDSSPVKQLTTLSYSSTP